MAINLKIIHSSGLLILTALLFVIQSNVLFYFFITMFVFHWILTLNKYLVQISKYSKVKFLLKPLQKKHLANFITCSRSCLNTIMLCMLSLNYINQSHYLGSEAFIVWITVMCFLLLDGVDGQIARRFNIQSSYGAYLDVEADSLFTLFMCLLFVVNYQFSAVLMVIGVLRYIVVVLREVFFKKLDQLVIRHPFGRWVYTVNCLVFSSLLFFNEQYVNTIIISITLLTILSFSCDLFFLIKAQIKLNKQQTKEQFYVS